MKTAWLSRVLLTGVALSAMGAAGHADELSALKAQLEQLQAQVNNLEAQPANPALPEGASWITFQRGSEATADWNTERPRDRMPNSGGFTVAITPSADLPAPVHEVTVSGYVKGDVIYDFDEDLGDAFSLTTSLNGNGKQDHVRLGARESRFAIKSKSDTAVGQIRTLIEGDFFSGGPFGGTDFRLRHAWGEWDMTPNWTLGVGQYWTNFMSMFTGISTVDFAGDVGQIGFNRTAQVRLSYTMGGNTFAVAVEDPTGDGHRSSMLVSQSGAVYSAAGNASDSIPNFTARWQFDAPGGHQFGASGVLLPYHTDSALGGESDTKFGWGVQGNANINLADIATVTTGVMYGNGIGGFVFAAPFGAFTDGDNIHLVETLGVFAGLIFNVTDTTSINLGWGYTKNNSNDIEKSLVENGNRYLMTAHANVMWQPVEQLKLGWEVMWGERKWQSQDIDIAGDVVGVDVHKDDAVRAQFGAWFYF
ncbi:hypothetical protein FHS85_003033 [Rhodoligotrophos appendicifer]|uniref:DcaP family trimeric outer membrane transporter n=1 Tax=Rhodoligotrophos appendicifer TaxID=987056 RepID=UPI0011857C23|nr:DcaP family trimeric outer membrane transporter [Rhodoligotrophos appendicifer]